MCDLKEMGLVGLYIDGGSVDQHRSELFTHHWAYAEAHHNNSWRLVWRCPEELSHLSGVIKLGKGYTLERGEINTTEPWRCPFGWDTTVDTLEAVTEYPPKTLTAALARGLYRPSTSPQEYGTKLIDAGMFPLSIEAEWSKEDTYGIEDEVRPAGWNNKEAWTTSQHGAYRVGQHWNKKGRTFNVHLGFSRLVALDLDIKKHPDYKKMTRDEAKRKSLELVPKEWFDSQCYKEFTKSGGLHLVWRCPPGIAFSGREKPVLQTVYRAICNAYKLAIPEENGKFPSLYEFFHCRLLRTYPTFGYEPIGDVQLLDAGEPPKSFLEIHHFNTNNNDPVHVEEAPKPKQNYKGSRRYKHQKYHQTIEEKKNSMTWEGLFSQYGVMRPIEKGSREYDLKCRSFFSEDNTPSFFFQSSGGKRFHCFSTNKDGDILDIEKYLKTGKEPNSI